MNTERRTQALIIGATTGGVAAALALARAGVRTLVVERLPWIGGQLTSQAVPPDENKWIETVGGTRSYQEFRERVRAWYRDNRTLTAEAKGQRHLNPGNGWVSRLCFEPAIGEGVLRGMLQPHLASKVLDIVHGYALDGAEVEGDRVRSVRFSRPGEALTVQAEYVLDATDLGDLYPLAKIEHAIGAESQHDYGEFHAPTGPANPLDQQAISWCFAMTHHPGEDHTIARPARYDFWRAYCPVTTPSWEPSGKPHPLFSWEIPTHEHTAMRTLSMTPWPDEPTDGAWELWRYRRIVDASLYEAESRSGGAERAPSRDVCLVNWVQMDYWLKPLLGVTPEQHREALNEAREQSLCLFYWMQTECPRHDGGSGYPGLRLCGEPLGTQDGFAQAAYIREPRRLLARQMLTEEHLGTAQRRRMGKPHQDATEMGCGELFPDSVGIGHYRIDLHPSVSGRGSVYVEAAPFRVPLGSLIPIRVRNVVGAGKAIGVSHIANACTRMHHTEWNIGESAGVLAAMCLTRGVEPAQVHDSPELVREYQSLLTAQGVRIRWPWEPE